MYRLFLIIFGTGLFFATSGFSTLAIFAVLGFIHPILDFFNHLQPFIFIGTFLALLLSLLFYKNKLLRPLIISIASIGFLSSAFIVLPDGITRIKNEIDNPLEENKKSYKILTQNLFGRNYDAWRTVNEIKKINPDIIAFQEYFYFQREAIHHLIAEQYPFYEICKGGKRNNIAIYSKTKFELDKASSCYIGERHRISRIIAKFKDQYGGEFSVVTTHLDWPLQVSKLNDGDGIKERLDLSIKRKTEQLADLSKAINSISTPIVLVGDLNSTPWSYALRDFAKKSGLSLLTNSMFSYPNRLYLFGDWRNVIPFLPLDHILLSDGIDKKSIKKGDPAGSDHNPIVLEFSVSEK